MGNSPDFALFIFTLPGENAQDRYSGWVKVKIRDRRPHGLVQGQDGVGDRKQGQ